MLDKPLLDPIKTEDILKASLTDSQIALLYNEVHLKRNQSFIFDLFFGQTKSTIKCLQCQTESKVYQQFMTLPLTIPQTKFDFHFYFVPYQINDRIFNYELNHLSMVEEATNPSNLSLYSLKAKICEIAKHFYGKDSHKDYKGRQVKYPLTNRNGKSVDYYSIDLTPHDLIITSVSTQPFRFSKIFSDEKHTLLDLEQEKNPMQIFTVFQLDPEAVDIDKINSVEPDFQHSLYYPHNMKPNYMLVPVENILLTKPHDECTDIKEMQFEWVPPRLLCINIERSLEDLFHDVMTLFVQALENKEAPTHQNPHQGQN